MGKKRNRLQKCSASTHADKAGEPSHHVKSESDVLEIVNLKKQKKPGEGDVKSDIKKETKEMRISFRDMVEATKKLVDLIPTKADLQDTSVLKKSDQDRKTTLLKESDEDEESALKKESDEDENTLLKKEIEEMTSSFKEMSEFVKKLQEKILTKADLLKYSFKEKVEEIHECCYETEGAFGNNESTIFVDGFKCSMTREEAKSELIKHFSSCGEVERVFVPIECKTGVPLGFAFIDMKTDEEKALTLDGSYLGRMRLLVTMAKTREEYIGFRNFGGCERCRRILMQRRLHRFHRSHGGRIIRLPYSPATVAAMCNVELRSPRIRITDAMIRAAKAEQGTATKPC